METHNYSRSCGSKLFINVNYFTGKELRGNLSRRGIHYVLRGIVKIFPHPTRVLVCQHFNYAILLSVFNYLAVKVYSVHKRVVPRGTLCVNFCRVNHLAVLGRVDPRRTKISL